METLPPPTARPSFPGPSTTSSPRSLPRSAPRTPPETPHHLRPKAPSPYYTPTHRRASPASPAASIHPTETISPAKPTPRPTQRDSVHVEELQEGDPGWVTDSVEIVHPAELEEAESEAEPDNDLSVNQPIQRNDEDEVLEYLSEASLSDTGISQRFSRLAYSGVVAEEAEFLSQRRRQRRDRRRGSRVFKRSHSKSVTNDSGVIEALEIVDPEWLADHDNEGSARRLRRRVNGPLDGGMREGRENAVLEEREVSPTPVRANPHTKVSAEETRRIGVGIVEIGDGDDDDVDDADDDASEDSEDDEAEEDDESDEEDEEESSDDDDDEDDEEDDGDGDEMVGVQRH